MPNDDGIDFESPTGSGGNEWFVEPLTNHSSKLLESMLGEKTSFLYKGKELFLFPISYPTLRIMLSGSRKQPPYFATYNAVYGKEISPFPDFSKQKPEYQTKVKEPTIAE